MYILRWFDKSGKPHLGLLLLLPYSDDDDGKSYLTWATPKIIVNCIEMFQNSRNILEFGQVMMSN